jgi:hypothetical protein
MLQEFYDAGVEGYGVICRSFNRARSATDLAIGLIAEQHLFTD